MAIVDEAFEIRQHLHRIKADEALVADGTELDKLGSDYSIGRVPLEMDKDFRHRVWLRIMKVMVDAAAAEVERRRSDADIAGFVVCWGAESAAARQRFWIRWAATG